MVQANTAAAFTPSMAYSSGETSESGSTLESASFSAIASCLPDMNRLGLCSFGRKMLELSFSAGLLASSAAKRQRAILAKDKTAGDRKGVDK